MTKETLYEARYYCDGCGYAVLESTAEHIEQAFEQCGWVHATTHHGDKVDYCPTCRRDSPFEAVQRVREVCDLWQRRPFVGELNSASRLVTLGRLGYRRALRDVLAALEGDSDE